MERDDLVYDDEITRLAKIASVLVNVITPLFRGTVERLYEGHDRIIEKHIVTLIKDGRMFADDSEKAIEQIENRTLTLKEMEVPLLYQAIQVTCGLNERYFSFRSSTKGTIERALHTLNKMCNMAYNKQTVLGYDEFRTNTEDLLQLITFKVSQRKKETTDMARSWSTQLMNQLNRVDSIRCYVSNTVKETKPNCPPPPEGHLLMLSKASGQRMVDSLNLYQDEEDSSKFDDALNSKESFVAVVNDYTNDEKNKN